MNNVPKELVNKSMKNFETHHVTIDLNEFDKQSTLQSTGCKNTLKSCEDSSKNNLEPVALLCAKMGQINKLIDRTSSQPKLSPKKAVKQSPMSHSKVLKSAMANYIDGSPMKKFIQSTLRDEYVIKHHNSVKPEMENQESDNSDDHYLFQRNPSKESDMCKPMSFNGDEAEPSEELDQDDIIANIDAYDNRLNKCLDLAASSDTNQFNIREQLFKAFGYDEAAHNSFQNNYYLKKRRNGMGTQGEKINVSQSQRNPDMLRNINSIVHIRQTWDPSQKITPSSSLKTSEFSKFNKFEDSEVSSDKTYSDPLNQLHMKCSKPVENAPKSNSQNSRNHSPKIMQKVLETLRNQKEKPRFNKSHHERPKESLNIIQKAKEACNQYLKQMEKSNMMTADSTQKLHSEPFNDNWESSKYESPEFFKPYFAPNVSPAKGDSKNRYRDYMLADEDMYSLEKKDSYLNREYWNNIFEEPSFGPQTHRPQSSGIVTFQKRRNISE